MCIMLGHSIDLAYDAAAHAARNVGSDYSSLALMAVRPLLGFVWVVGFIVISGYCVTQSCMRASGQTLIGFAALRVSRLFPLLWASVFLAIAVETIVHGSLNRPAIWTTSIDAWHAWINIAGLGGFFGQYGSLAPAYTLSYELAFYALWAIAWFGARRRPVVAMTACVVLAAGLFVGGRRLLPFGGTLFSDWVLLLFLCWCIGAAVALWLPVLATRAISRTLAPFRWIAVVGVMWVGWSAYQMPLLRQVTRVSLFYYLTLAVGFAFLTIGFLARRVQLARTPLDRWLGLISYPLFITHGPVIIGVATLYRRLGVSLGFGPYVLALAAPAILIGLFFAVAVDRPVMAWRERIRSRTQARTLKAEFA